MHSCNGEQSVPRTVEFPLGLPGFEQSHRFMLLQTTPPIFILESAEPEAVRFYTIPVSILDDAYQIEMTEDTAELLCLNQSFNGSGLTAFSILTASPDGRVTANLLAPILVNLNSGLAVQAVRADAKYSHRHPVLPHSPTVQDQENPRC